MIRKKKHFRNFNLDNEIDVIEYNELLNNRFCTILEREKIVESIKHYEEGKLVRTDDEIHYLIHWEERLI